MLVLLSPPQTHIQEQNIWKGNDNSTLSERGKEEILSIADILKPYKFTRIYASPETHIMEVVELCNLQNVVYLHGFISRSMGKLTGRSYKETMDEFPRRKWLEWNRSYIAQPPEGESFFDIRDRVLGDFKSKILPIVDNDIVLIVCDVDILKTLIGDILKIEEVNIPKINIENTIPYIIHWNLR